MKTTDAEGAPGMMRYSGMKARPSHRGWLLALFCFFAGFPVPSNAQKPETLGELTSRLGRESNLAYEASRFSLLSKDYFARFHRDSAAEPNGNETAIDSTWKIVLSARADPLAELMAGYLVQFLDERMDLRLEIENRDPSQLDQPGRKRILLLDSGGGDPGASESFTISIDAGSVVVRGRDARGLRDGIVKLVDLMGFREAPIFTHGEQIYRPRLKVRLGAIPRMGSIRDLVFLGYNALFAGGGSLYALSTSDAIPELASRRNPDALRASAEAGEDARRHGLKTYAFLSTRQKFAKDHAVFMAHPEIRGALTWRADGEYVLCTEHALVQRFLRESVEGLFRADPELNGIVLIIGGEGFYHCFMRPYGVEKGRTNCKRCDPLGAERVVANLCNLLAGAARSINPEAEVVVWPYSAEHVWSADKTQSALIELLEPGVALFTEIEKDEYVQKDEGVNKHIWDYSIDLIGPGERAKRQIADCQTAGLSVYLKSEPELGFEAPRLPHIPCMDRWVARADALASCGADGAWVFPAFRPCYGTSAAEINKHFWWEPKPDPDVFLMRFAKRLAGEQAGPHLREAWKYVSEAIAFSPELPSYYKGPYYLGPAHPMFADRDAHVPDVFHGHYLFLAEMTDAEGLKTRPTFVRSPTGNVPVFGRFYRRMEELLKKGVDEIGQAEPLVPEERGLMFDAEASAVRWFYHTARTEANFYESCVLRDRLHALAGKSDRTPEEIEQARLDYARWRSVLEDEKANAEAALPIMEADMRLDFYYGSDHTFPHGADMIRAKLEIIEREIERYLPSLAERIGL